MWVPRYASAPRARLRRIFIMLATPLLVAFFTVAGPLSQISYANPGTWESGSLHYDGNIYSPAPDSAPTQPGKEAYQWIDQAANPAKAHLIYFDDADEVATQDTASLVVYDYAPPDNYTNPSGQQSIDIVPSTSSDLTQAAESEGVITTCADSSGLGYIICPVSYYLAEGTDRMYRLVRDFLEVPPATANPDSGLYQLWSLIRSIANVCFVIVFLFIIYSQVTSIGISNYGIKFMLPRLIIGAVLVNVSFWISAIGIDVSNVLGHGVYAIFDNVRHNMDMAVDVDASKLTAFILSGGVAVGIAGLIGAGGSIAGIGFLLLTVLVSMAFGVFVAFVVLAARQALLTVLLLLSPLAFVAYVLPGTQSLFDRWRKSFITLLAFFPLFALLFGGSAVASVAIIDNANGLLHIVLIGLAVQAVPLVITPFLVQFSTGLLGRIAGIANRQSGVVDRAKGWARENAAHHRERALAQERTLSPFKKGAQALNRHNLRKANRRDGYQAAAKRQARGGSGSPGQRRIKRSWEDSDLFKRQAEADLAQAEGLDTAKYKDLQAGVNTYSKAEASPALNWLTKGRYQELLDENHQKQSAQEVAAAKETALRTALDGTRAAMAERKQSQNYAEEIANTSRYIDGVNVQEYAAGVMEQMGLNSVLSSAKKTVSEADMKDAQNIQDTMSYELQNDPEALSRAFLNASTMTERLAYANQMAQSGGPGFRALRKTIVEWEDRGQSPVDLNMMKELLGTNGTIMSGGKDLETWITNDGGRRRPFETISNDVTTWSNLSAKAFASMNQISQSHALNLMKNSDTALYNDYRRTLQEDPTALSAIKITIRREHDLFRPGEYIPPED